MTSPIRQISAPELKAMLDARTPFEFIDVRTPMERELAFIPGSRLLDQAVHDELMTRDKDALIVFQCHHGMRSQGAAEYFRQAGFTNLINVSGGIDAWSSLVDSTVPRY